MQFSGVKKTARVHGNSGRMENSVFFTVDIFAVHNVFCLTRKKQLEIIFLPSHYSFMKYVHCKYIRCKKYTFFVRPEFPCTLAVFFTPENCMQVSAVLFVNYS